MRLFQMMSPSHDRQAKVQIVQILVAVKGGSSLPPCLPDPEIEKLRTQQCKQRAKIVLWRKPITTLHYFSRELLYELQKLAIG